MVSMVDALGRSCFVALEDEPELDGGAFCRPQVDLQPLEACNVGLAPFHLAVHDEEDAVDLSEGRNVSSNERPQRREHWRTAGADSHLARATAELSK